MSEASTSLHALMTRAPVIPVLAIESADTAPALARALVEGGLPVLEVTLRTPAAFPAVEAIVREVPEAVVGVGTLTRAEEAIAARDAGARFLVSPGLTDALIGAALNVDIPLLPGVATPSELMRAVEAGFDHLKFFPAEVNGGMAALKALAGPFPSVRFCPTGGISPGNYLDYLALPNVLCVGGSWLAPGDAVAAGDWPRITALAAAVAGGRSAVEPARSARGTAEDWYSVAGEEDPGSADEALR